MRKFEYREYLNAPMEEVLWDDDKKGFTITVGTTNTVCFQNQMDKAGMLVLKYCKFHVRKEGNTPVLEVVSYNGKDFKPILLSDAQKVKLAILQMQMGEFISNYPFTGEGFSSFARNLLRPMRSGCCKHNKSWVEKYENQ